ncbi:pentapeptide repeat-containing protein [Streptomyces violaceusniger]|uniref:Pentapeptide repeat protein n=1 Tax=Streptomyces violaceusniger TaxID=68280 RepID=A0A4D4L710_STRVO|nr:hypothetical protein SVIO_044220 [Streptomyces violaceusniger]
MTQAIRRGGRTTRIKNPTAPKVLATLRPADMARDGLEDDAMIRGVQYEGTPFVALAAESVELEGCTFDSSRFTGTRLIRSQFSDCRFNACDFAEVGAQEASSVAGPARPHH